MHESKYVQQIQLVWLCANCLTSDWSDFGCISPSTAWKWRASCLNCSWRQKKSSASCARLKSLALSSSCSAKFAATAAASCLCSRPESESLQFAGDVAQDAAKSGDDGQVLSPSAGLCVPEFGNEFTDKLKLSGCESAGTDCSSEESDPGSVLMLICSCDSVWPFSDTDCETEHSDFRFSAFEEMSCSIISKSTASSMDDL